MMSVNPNDPFDYLDTPQSIKDQRDLARHVDNLRRDFLAFPERWENWATEAYLGALHSVLDDNPPDAFQTTGVWDPSQPTWRYTAETLSASLASATGSTIQADDRWVQSREDFLDFVERLLERNALNGVSLDRFLGSLSNTIGEWTAPIANRTGSTGPTWHNLAHLLYAASAYE